jgi:hypothetical protein
MTSKGQQRSWDYIPKRNCMWESQTQKAYIYTLLSNIFLFVAMHITVQVTNQSSHGELSFHHNPYLHIFWSLGLFTSRVARSGGSRLKNAAHPTYCHCCEFCALKQKPGVLLEIRTERNDLCVRASFVLLHIYISCLSLCTTN